MARKRMAKPEEIETALREALRRLGDSLLTPGAPRAIEARLIQLQAEYRMWAHFLTLLKTAPKKQLGAWIAADLNKMRAEQQQAKLTVEDLENVMRFFQAIADTVEGKEVQVQNGEAFFKTMQRLARPSTPTLRRFKPAFEQAFREQIGASQRGEVITAQALAQALTRYEYKRNPESAIRAMQRGISRVRAEHERCLRESIDSPFFEGEPQNAQLKRSRT